MAEECRSCHAPIDWAVKFPEEMNDKGMPKTIPIDHGSWDDPKGNIVAWRGEALPLRDGSPGPSLIYARYLKKGEEPKEGEHRGISHFATCPESGQWRRNARPAASVTERPGAATGAQPQTRTTAADLRAGASRIEREAPVFADRMRREADSMEQWPAGSNGEAANR